MTTLLRDLTIDTVAVVLRGTVLNPGLTAPVAAAVTWILEPDTFGSPPRGGSHTSGFLSQLGLAAWVLTAAGLALRLHEQLNTWTANNWTRDGTWDWDKEIVLITGGSSGIGAAMAQQLVARNPRTKIVVVDYVPLTWQPAPGSDVRYFRCDLSDQAAVRATCDRVRRQVGDPTVLISNAGLSRGLTVLDGAYADVALTIDTNLVAPFLLLKEFLPHMVKSNHGHVVHVGSMSSIVPPARIADYAATKAGLVALHEALQLELKYIHQAPKVRLTLGIFGFIRTLLFRGQTGQSAFLFPLLEPETVAGRLVDTLYSGLGKTMYLPGIMRYVAMLITLVMAQSSETSNVDKVTYSQFACIGSGFAAIGLGAQLKRWYGIEDVQFFERHHRLGGTWFINQYPGCACDVPSVLYSFSFEPNPNWTRVLPTYSELWSYLDRVAHKYDLVRKMAFDVLVERCEWVEERARWRMTIRHLKSGATYFHECQFLFAGTGALVTPREIDVPGADTFGGVISHTGRWRPDIDLEGKRVVLFGNGCTAAQVVPSIVRKTRSLTQIVRSKHWIFPPIDAKVPDWVRLGLNRIPGMTTLQRLAVFVAAEYSLLGFPLTEAGRRFRARQRRVTEAYMRAAAPAKYHDLLIPDFEVGCKRRIFDAGYLESLHADNMTLTDEKPLEIVPEGVRTAGRLIEADVIILANGYHTNEFAAGVEVVGRGGETMRSHWDSFGGPEAYNCSVLSGFPNFVLLLGPNAATGHTSSIMALENSINYALRVLKPALQGRASTVDLKREAERAYSDTIQAALQKTVWNSGCNSWYQMESRGADGSKKWNAMSYPYSQAHFWYRCLFPVWSDWDYSSPCVCILYRLIHRLSLNIDANVLVVLAGSKLSTSRDMPPDLQERQRRRKIALACEPCRERKARCDGGKPICSTCQRRSLDLEHCVYKTGNARTAYTKTLHERIRKLEQACASHGIDVNTLEATEQYSRTPLILERRSSSVHDSSPLGGAPGIMDQQPPVQLPSPCSGVGVGVGVGVDHSCEARSVTAMGTIFAEDDLDDSPDKPEKDFYGSSSAVSFLKEALKEAYYSATNPLPSRAESSSVMFKSHQQTALGIGERATFADFNNFLLPPRPFADHLIQVYFRRIHYLYPVFHRPAFEHAYESLWRPSTAAVGDAAAAAASAAAASNPFHGVGLGCSPGADSRTIVFHAALNSMFALACNYADLTPPERAKGVEVFILRSRQYFGIDLLEKNNLGVVQTLLLCGLVMQGTPFPDRCWNAIGTACRIAQGLGLHMEASGERGDATLEKEIRRRTWHGCVILDTLVSMTFGRPTAAACFFADDPLPQPQSTTAETDSEKARLQFSSQSLELSLILDDILWRMYQPWKTRRHDATLRGPRADGTPSLDAIVELDSRLDDFERSVPHFLSWLSPSSSSSSSLLSSEGEGIAAEDQQTIAIQKNVLYARFLYVRLILHRPILTKLLAGFATPRQGPGVGEPTPGQFPFEGLRAPFTTECAR
ncbi:Baeyer-Villiger monooxygenase, partial [Colletotrichum tanaceti]